MHFKNSEMYDSYVIELFSLLTKRSSEKTSSKQTGISHRKFCTGLIVEFI